MSPDKSIIFVLFYDFQIGLSSQFWPSGQVIARRLYMNVYKMGWSIVDCFFAGSLPLEGSEGKICLKTNGQQSQPCGVNEGVEAGYP